jgi:hypothetical protein
MIPNMNRPIIKSRVVLVEDRRGAGEAAVLVEDRRGAGEAAMPVEDRRGAGEAAAPVVPFRRFLLTRV